MFEFSPYVRLRSKTRDAGSVHRIVRVRHILFALLACVALSSLSPLSAQSDDISWYDNYDEAIREAKRTGKPIFLEFRCER